MTSGKKLTKKEVQQEPAFNIWLRKIQEYFATTAGNGLIKLSAGLIIILIILAGVYGFYTNNLSKAEAAFGKALEIYNAQVKDPTASPSEQTASNKKIYDDEKQKYKEAITAFQQAATFSSQNEKSKYYIALCDLKLDATKGQKELQELSGKDGEVSQMARLALADSYVATGQISAAIDLYKQLQSIWEKNKGINAIVSPAFVQFTLGNLYEAQDKTSDACQAYLQVLQLNSKSRIAVQAYERLTILDPESARKMQSPNPQDDDSM